MSHSSYREFARSQPSDAPSPEGIGRIAEDARLYRKTVRPALVGKKVTPEQEGRLMHAHAVHRGLKVAKGEAPGYVEATHTFVHPTPDDHSAVGRDYFRLVHGVVKLARRIARLSRSSGPGHVKMTDIIRTRIKRLRPEHIPRDIWHAAVDHAHSVMPDPQGEQGVRLYVDLAAAHAKDAMYKRALGGGKNKPTKLARPKKAEQSAEEKALMGAIWAQWQAHRKHLADNERRGRPNVHEGAPPRMDDNARLTFADWLAEQGDPREVIARGHVEPVRNPGWVATIHHPEHADNENDPAVFGGHWDSQLRKAANPLRDDGKPDTAYDFRKDLIHPAYAQSGVGTRATKFHPVILWRHAGTTSSRNSTGPATKEHPIAFSAPVTANQFHDYVDRIGDPKKQAEWKDFAKQHGFDKRTVEPKPAKTPRRPKKLARARADDMGAAQASAGSKGGDSRIQIAKEILKEAGLNPSTVRAAIAHTEGGNRASVVQIVKRATDQAHTRYAAAWRGLMLNEPSVMVFHPDDTGDDHLHIINAPHPPDYIAEQLRTAGVPRFVTEKTDSGSRAYVVNPMGKHPIERIARGIPNARHSSVRGVGYRIGSGPSAPAASGKPAPDAPASSGSRSAYRNVIDKFESEAA